MKRIQRYVIFFTCIALSMHTAFSKDSIEDEPQAKEDYIDEPQAIVTRLKHIFELSGYVNYKAFYDTRQFVGVSEGQTLYFPKRKVCSPTGDINSKGQGTMLPIETRLRGTMYGPDIKTNVKETGVIEVEFRGKQDAVNLVNMRHAYGQIDWHNGTFIFGQTWHPLNVVELIPNTVSFNRGRPFAVYTRSPMVNYTYHSPTLDVILAATSQVDYKSDGPIGLSTTYIRDAVIPNLHFQLKGFLGDHIAGAGIDYQRIAPRLVSRQGYKVHEYLSSLCGIGYLKLSWPKIDIRNSILFGGNISNYGIIGGYAVQRGTTNPITGERKYTTIRTLTGWTDLTYTHSESFETGFFVGAAKNFGSRKQIEHNVIDLNGIIIERRIYGLGNDLDTVYRASGRMRFNIKQITFALEVEYTRAAFGDLRISPDGLNAYGRAVNPISVANTQILFSTFLFF